MASNTHAEDAAIATGKTSAPMNSAARSASGDAVNDVNAHGNDPIPQLLATIRGKDSGERTKAAESLVRLGGEAVPALIEALKDDTPDRVAAGILRQTGEAAHHAVPGLIEQFTTGCDLTTRCQAAYALSVLGSAANDAAPVLIAAVEDGDITVRCSAARALGHIGAEDREVISALAAALGLSQA